MTDIFESGGSNNSIVLHFKVSSSNNNKQRSHPTSNEKFRGEDLFDDEGNVVTLGNFNKDFNHTWSTSKTGFGVSPDYANNRIQVYDWYGKRRLSSRRWEDPHSTIWTTMAEDDPKAVDKLNTEGSSAWFLHPGEFFMFKLDSTEAFRFDYLDMFHTKSVPYHGATNYWPRRVFLVGTNDPRGWTDIDSPVWYHVAWGDARANMTEFEHLVTRSQYGFQYYRLTCPSDSNKYIYYRLVINETGSNPYRTGLAGIRLIGDVSDIGSGPPPNSPATVNANQITGEDDITITWSQVDGDITEYVIYKQIGSGGTFEELTRTSSLSYTDNDVVLGTPIKYAISAVNSSGEGNTKSSAFLTVVVKAPAPQNITATLSGSDVVVSFDAPISDGGDPIDYYTIDAEDASTGVTTSFTAYSSPFTATGLTGGKEYFFYVTPVNDAGSGTRGTAASSVTIFAPPAAITDFTASSNDYKNTTLNWNPPDNNGGNPITGYSVEYKKTQDTFYNAIMLSGSDSLSGFIDDLSNDQAYDVRVAAINAYGMGEYSDVIQIIPGIPEPNDFIDQVFTRKTSNEDFVTKKNNGLIDVDDIKKKVKFTNAYNAEYFTADVVFSTQQERNNARKALITQSITLFQSHIGDYNITFSPENFFMSDNFSSKASSMRIMRATNNYLEIPEVQTLSITDLEDGEGFYILLEEVGDEVVIVTPTQGSLVCIKTASAYTVTKKRQGVIVDTSTYDEGDELEYDDVMIVLGSVAGVYLGPKEIDTQLNYSSSTLWAYGTSVTGSTRYSRAVVATSSAPGPQLQIETTYYNNVSLTPSSTMVTYDLSFGTPGKYLWWDYTWTTNPSSTLANNTPSSFFSPTSLTFVIENPIGTSGWSITPSAYDHTATLPINQLMWGNGAFRGQGYNGNIANYPYIDYTQFYQDTPGALLNYSSLSASNSGDAVSVICNPSNSNTLWWNDDTSNPTTNTTINRRLKYLTFSVEMPFLDDITSSHTLVGGPYVYRLTVGSASHDTSTSSTGNGFWVYHIEESSSGNFPSSGTFNGQFHYQTGSLSTGTWSAGTDGYVIRNNSASNSGSGSKTKLHISIGLPNGVNLSIESVGVTFYAPP